MFRKKTVFPLCISNLQYSVRKKGETRNNIEYKHLHIESEKKQQK